MLMRGGITAMTCSIGITIDQDGSTTRVVPRGELYCVTSGDLGQAISGVLRAVPRPVAVLVDLSEVSFLDCAGVAVLLRGRVDALALGATYQVTDGPGPARHVLTLLHLDTMLLTRACPARRRRRPRAYAWRCQH
jgi:anti-anti-sigma factor